jgi:hypothetical protein
MTPADRILVPMFLLLAIYVGISVRILRSRAITSRAQLFCWILSGALAAACAIRVLRA